LTNKNKCLNFVKQFGNDRKRSLKTGLSVQE